MSIKHDQSEMNVLFVHSSLDDYPLTPEEFRIYAHIARRASGKDGAFPSIAGMADKCQMHEDTVRTAVKTLERYRMLTRLERPGYTTLYTLTRPSEWLPPTEAEATKPKRGRSSSKTTPPLVSPPRNKGGGTPPLVSPPSPPKQREGYPPETNGAEGNPLEGNPFKVIQEEEAAAAAVVESKILQVGKTQNSKSWLERTFTVRMLTAMLEAPDAPLPRSGWLNVPLERLEALHGEAKTAYTRDGRKVLTHLKILLDEEIRLEALKTLPPEPPSTALALSGGPPRASPGRGRPQTVEDVTALAVHNAATRLQHLERTRGPRK